MTTTRHIHVATSSAKKTDNGITTVGFLSFRRGSFERSGGLGPCELSPPGPCEISPPGPVQDTVCSTEQVSFKHTMFIVNIYRTQRRYMHVYFDDVECGLLPCTVVYRITATAVCMDNGPCKITCIYLD